MVIIDNSALKHLVTDDARARFMANLKAGGWVAWPSAVNFLEAMKDRNGTRRARLLGTIKWLAGDRGLLPLPYDVLEAGGRAVLSGGDHYTVDWSGYEWLLEPESIEPGHVDAAEKFIAGLDGQFQALHDRARKRLQPELRALADQTTRGYDCPTFLDEVWLKPDFLDAYLSDIWRGFGLPEPVPIDALRQLPSWRLFVDAYGVVAYFRAFAREQSRPIQLADVLQLVYLSAGPKRVIITEDVPFRRAAASLLRGRYPNTCAASITDFLG